MVRATLTSMPINGNGGASEMNSYECELYEYVMESALFEVDSGDNRYQAVYEAAEEKADKTNDSFFAKLKARIVNFCRSIISKAKMIISRIGNLRRAKAAKKALNKLTADDPKKGPNLKKGTAISGAGKNIAELNFLTDKLNSDIPAIGSLIEKLVEDSSSEYEKISYNNRSNARKMNSDLGFVDFDEMKTYLDSIVKYANQLNQSIKNIDGIRTKLKSAGYSASQIRIGISSVYSGITKYLKKYYDEVMTVYSNFVKNSDIIDKVTKNLAESDYKHKEEMNEIIEKMKNRNKNKTDGENRKGSKYYKEELHRLDKESDKIFADIDAEIEKIRKMREDPNATLRFE